MDCVGGHPYYKMFCGLFEIHQRETTVDLIRRTQKGSRSSSTEQTRGVSSDRRKWIDGENQQKYYSKKKTAGR